MTIYDELVTRVSDGERFYVDFESQTIKVGKDKLVDNGEYDEDRTLYTNATMEMSDVMAYVETLYENYKYSLPSERSDSKRKKYFKALSIEDIPDDKLMTMQKREIAQCELEAFILCMVLDGFFVWEDISNGWFYQSTRDPDLVILKKWIESN